MEILCSPSRNPSLASPVSQSLPGASVPAGPSLATCPILNFPVWTFSSPAPSPLGSAAPLSLRCWGPEPSVLSKTAPLTEQVSLLWKQQFGTPQASPSLTTTEELWESGSSPCFI